MHSHLKLVQTVDEIVTPILPHVIVIIKGVNGDDSGQATPYVQELVGLGLNSHLVAYTSNDPQDQDTQCTGLGSNGVCLT